MGNGVKLPPPIPRSAIVEALQIEVRYHVYLDENELERSQHPNWVVPQFLAKRRFDENFCRNCLKH